MNKEYGVYAGIGAILISIVAGVWWMRANQAPTDLVSETVATSSDFVLATSSNSDLQVQVVTEQKPSPAKSPSFALVPGEAVASWNFTGSYRDGGTLEAKVNAEIQKMKGLLASGAANKYELYISIANQYDLLGDGKQEYTYLNYALGVDSTKTGLAWHNMGKLLERLGAYKTARVAYDRMIQAQPTSQYIRARLDFLKAHMPEDTAAIKQAEADLSASTW